MNPLDIFKCALFQSLESPRASFKGCEETVAQNGPPLEVHERNGLGNFLSALAEKLPVTIAYFGGSITEQDGWRLQSLEWLTKEFPDSEISHVNAAIGGTGSLMGVFRLRQDVIQKKPHLVFVEFAVNDDGAPITAIRNAIEGIVRQIKSSAPFCDICFVYTISEKDVNELNLGKLKTSEIVMEEVAEHYGIPSIHFGVSIASLVKDGQLKMKPSDGEVNAVNGDSLNLVSDASCSVPIFSPDGLHPYIDVGHRLYTESFKRAFQKIRSVHAVNADQLRAPLHPNNWESAASCELDANLISGHFVLMPAGEFAELRGRLPNLFRLAPGSSINFRFVGKKIAFGDVIGPDCGTLQITVNGKIVRYKNRFDMFGNRHRVSLLDVPLDEINDVHEISIRVLRRRPRKWQILLPQYRKDMIKHPLKYWGANWYVGKIYLVGKIL